MSHLDLANNINKSLSGDFINNGPLIDDSAGHGTHVAGSISAQAKNGLGIAGVSYNADEDWEAREKISRLKGAFLYCKKY